MPIQSGDLKFFKSQNMTDADEGGGAPTSQEIVDGASNSIFPDVSELDRAMGRVNIRKVFGAVVTETTETYLGANVVIAEPPDDPNVSIAIVKVDDFFATRKDIQTRVESFLALGATYAGYLFGNMLQGQQVVTILQRTNVTLPDIGATLVLRKRSGQLDELVQFVRITGIASQLRTFEDNNGIYERNVVTLSISESLLADFLGFDANRVDPSIADQALRTTIYESVVADAARYYGTVPLEEDVAIGDFTLKAESIYTRIVPSAQVETPIADARTNGVSVALTSTGTPITVNFSASLYPGVGRVFLGGAVLPGSVTIYNTNSASPTYITDSGGSLIVAGATVGTMDYENGVATLTVDVFNNSNPLPLVATYTPAALPSVVSRSIGIPVSIASRSLSYVLTLASLPAYKSLVISYSSGGRWYILRDEGSGRIAGSDPAYGVGNLNRVTNTLSLTLGALPDTGSAIILQWADDARVEKLTNTSMLFNGAFYIAMNSSGEHSEDPGAGALVPGSVTITWNQNGDRTATDNGNGVITSAGSYAIGTVDYQAGVIRLHVSVLPAKGTVFTITQQKIASVTGNFPWTGSGPFTASLPTNLTPNTIFIPVIAQLRVTATTATPAYYADPNIISVGGNVVDDGAGALKLRGVTVGTVNYTTGAVSLDFSGADFDDPALTPNAEALWSVLADAYVYTGTTLVATTVLTPILPSMHPSDRVLTRTTISIAPSSTVTYSVASAASSPISVTLNEIWGRVNYLAPGHTLTGVNFRLGATTVKGTNAGLLVAPTSYNSGTSTPIGEFNASTGLMKLGVWDNSISPFATSWSAIQAPPLDGVGDVGANVSVMFRIASAPVRPGSFSFIADMEDGTNINVSAGLNGKINHPRVKGRINYENGVVELYFAMAGTSPLGTYDISYMEIPGVTTINLDRVDAATMRYNAVAYSYIPLDASIIGLNPVRLPSDGRVPIIRPGSMVVVGNTSSLPPATVSNAQVLDTGRTRLSRVRLRGNNGVLINTGYTANLDTGLVTIDDITGWSQPVTLEHRIEDMALVADAQINGEIRLTRPLTHDFPAAGTYVSSALVLGDVYSRMTTMFDQQSWTGVTWPTSVTGNAAPGTYNIAAFPLELTNEGAVTESWALQFTSNTAGNVIGKHVGVVGTFNINTVTAPLNPGNNVPYWRLLEGGWGTGWSAGNVVFFDTIGATYPICLVRVVQQGPESGINYAFSMLSRGDVDRP